MNFDIVKITFLAMSSLVIILLTKKFNSDCAFAVSCITGISITVFAIGILIPIFNYIRSLDASVKYGGFASLLIKSTGVCLLCTTACGICRDCKEETVAQRLELAGKCTLLSMALPLIKTVLEYAKTFIS